MTYHLRGNVNDFPHSFYRSNRRNLVIRFRFRSQYQHAMYREYFPEYGCWLEGQRDDLLFEISYNDLTEDEHIQATLCILEYGE